ncbi:ninjurin-1 [Procambarus clarkii]|uniref:ninjurin-1 n=1 Tax=Procambarus clarkii TaxID=6728 RepID=UPI001E679030|nr:ninjurin-1-like [Procambarus clarkii]
MHGILSAGHDGSGVAHGKHPIDLNVMKRNMTIAKGFLDISLLSANANQLRNIINFGDTDSSIYYLVLSGIIVSLILQVSAGIILIVAERYDLNNQDDDEWSDRLNTVVIALIFVVLLVNVFVSSLGVDVANPSMHSTPPSIMSASRIAKLTPSTFSPLKTP